MEREIRRLLQASAAERPLYYFDVLDSTNTCLKQLAQEGAPHGTVVIADCQTAGRGRMDRSFQSPAGKGLYLSVLLRPDLPPERLLPVTAQAGVAACDAVEQVCGVRPGLKWPNDLVLGGRKLCGILTELGMDADLRPWLVVGIGVNVSQTAADFSPDVAEIATSLTAQLQREVSRAALAAALIESMDRLYVALTEDSLGAYLAAYRRDCVNLGRTVQLLSVDGRRETAEAVDVDDTFGLIVRTVEEEKTVRSGEVSVRGLYGYVE